MKTITNKEAERKILITIEYIRYSNIDTPSHARVLSPSDQVVYFKENFHPDTLQFYLMDNCDFEQEDFNLKRMQASTLCRLVTQLRLMTEHYPDETTLEQIIRMPDSLVVGDPAQETMPRLTGLGRITTSLELVVSEEVITNRF